MTTEFTKEDLVNWIEGLKIFAEGDHELLISWFKGTKHQPFSIIGGWMRCFSENAGVDDLFCCSKSNPTYVMCVKIVQNKGPYAYTDYEIMNMPYDPETGDVDDTEQMLEWEDDPAELADFLTHEWERIMETYN